mmetsp:Transcript_42197/g.82801  ORF Transcript_42197/g.82801 Transcript_42197/m.82801 type:complete len:310 (+) Transcript_42197:85-1014(+)
MSAESGTIPSGIGFIGLGIMGRGMVSRLLTETSAGSPNVPLICWNRTASKCQDLIDAHSDKNIVIASSPAEVVSQCCVVYSILSTPEASRSVFEATDGTLSGVHKYSAIIDCATLAESDMTRMAEQVKTRGGRFMEAPVSGSKGPAESGTLIFLCAGDRTVFEEVAVTAGLSAMGKASHFLNEAVGHGTRAKLVVNSLMGTMMAAYSEGLALSEAVGLPAEKMVEIIGQGAVASPLYALKGPKMIAGNHAPNFPLKHAHKDMALAKDMAAGAGAEYSVMNSAEALFRLARDNEMHANKDFSAVHEVVNK